MPQDRELRTLDDAVSLLDEWQSAYRELEGQAIRLDHAWAEKYRELEYEMHRLQALEYNQFAERAAERLASLESECPF